MMIFKMLPQMYMQEYLGDDGGEIAQALIDTYTGANKALAQGGIFGAISAAGIVAAGLANVARIKSTNPETGAGGGGGGGADTNVPQPTGLGGAGLGGPGQYELGVGFFGTRHLLPPF